MQASIKEDVSCYASETQQRVLGRIAALDLVAENFFLTGGTTLSVFYLHHRISEDIDLFSTRFDELNAVDTTLKRTFKQEATVTQSSSMFYSYLISGIKVDVVFDPLSTVEERPRIRLETGKWVLVDTLGNIASNKLAAMASRTEAKDIIDFFFIGDLVWRDRKEKSFLACYELARKKEAFLDDPATAAYQIEESFNRILEAGEKALPPMKRKIDWMSFEEDLRLYIDMVYRMDAW